MGHSHQTRIQRFAQINDKKKGQCKDVNRRKLAQGDMNNANWAVKKRAIHLKRIFAQGKKFE